MKNKQCFDCKVFRPIDRFSKNRTRGDGLNSRCKSCDSKYTKKRAMTNIYKLSHKKIQKIYSKDNKDKINAHRIAKKFKLKKEYCENCNSKDNLEMHHPDYKKPKEVKTLCVNCHNKIHHNIK